MSKYLNYFAATLISFFIISCGKNLGDDEQVCNGLVPPDTTSALVVHSATGDSIIINAAFWKIDTTGPLNYTYGSFKEIQETEKYGEINRFMSSLISGVAGNQFLSENNFSFTLFLDGSIQKIKSIEREHVLGYSIYTVHDHVLQHQLYVKIKNDFTEIQKLSMQVNTVDIGTFRLLAKKFFQPQSKSIIAFQLGYTDSSKAEYFKFQRTGRDLAQYLSR